MRHCISHRSCMVLVILLAGGRLAFADGFRNPPEGVATLGRVGGRIVYGDDMAAGVHNPANLIDRDALMLGAGLTTVYGKRTFTSDRYGFTARSTDRWAYLPSVFAAQGFADGAYAVGLALTSPYGRSSTFSKHGPMRYLAPYYSQLRTVNIGPAAAVRLGDRVAIGAGVNVLWSDLDMRQIVPGAALSGDPNDAGDGRITFEGDGVGYGVGLGLRWDLDARQRVAVSYRSMVKVTYEGDMAAQRVGGPELLRDDFETALTFPNVIALGYGIHATDALRVEANVEWVQHSKFDRMELDVGDSAALLPSTTIPADWRDNWTFGLGVDWRVSREWVLRAGYMYLQSPVPSRTMIPLVAEADQSVVSLGVGYADGPHRLDFAVMLGVFESRRVKENLNPDYTGKYEFDSQLLALAYAYQF